LASQAGHLERVDGEFGAEMIGDRPTHRASASGFDDDGEVDPALTLQCYVMSWSHTGRVGQGGTGGESDLVGSDAPPVNGDSAADVRRDTLGAVRRCRRVRRSGIGGTARRVPRGERDSPR
jgi:hypothetical protein